MPDAPSLRDQLRWWRQRRGLSQLELAGRAGISQRHLSFVELGRAAPSRDVVLRIAGALSLPKRQQNALLLAAGFAPVWRETRLGEPELGLVDRALDHILAQQEPYPAVVVDRRWNLLRSNAGAAILVDFLVGPLPPGTPVNLADALVAPGLLRPHLANWQEIVRHFVSSVESDAWEDGTSETTALLERLMSYEGVRAALRTSPSSASTGPVLPMEFRKDGTTLRLFTTIATLGTPQNVTLDELRIECFFPMDDATASWFARSPASLDPGSQPVVGTATAR